MVYRKSQRIPIMSKKPQERERCQKNPQEEVPEAKPQEEALGENPRNTK